MPVFDRFRLEKLSQQTGFVRDNLEKRFVAEFNVGHYVPSLLFDDSNIIERVEKHPMASWKMQHLAK